MILMMNDGNIVQLGEFSQTTETTTPTHPPQKNMDIPKMMWLGTCISFHIKNDVSVCIVYLLVPTLEPTNRSSKLVATVGGALVLGSFGGKLVGLPVSPSLLG